MSSELEGFSFPRCNYSESRRSLFTGTGNLLAFKFSVRLLARDEDYSYRVDRASAKQFTTTRQRTSRPTRIPPPPLAEELDPEATAAGAAGLALAINIKMSGEERWRLALRADLARKADHSLVAGHGMARGSEAGEAAPSWHHSDRSAAATLLTSPHAKRQAPPLSFSQRAISALLRLIVHP